MEILTQQLGDALEVKVRGRLDNYWAEHLQSNLEEIIRGGAHIIVLNLSDVSYLSSAGVGLLVRFYKQLKGLGGSFVIANPSENVKVVVELCHLSAILFSAQAAVAPPERKSEVRRFASSAASFELLECASPKQLICERIGDPTLLNGCRFGPENCRTVAFPPAAFGFGLGAFGNGFEDAQSRFGEFLAAGGCAAYLPTDGTNVPDFMVSTGDLVPRVNVLYGLRCEGGFTHRLQFEASDSKSISLAEVVRAALESSGAPTVAMVMLAESAGLVGAALRRSPAATQGASDAPFQYPAVRNWLSFSTERLYPRSLVLISGVASASECAPLAPFLRPLGTETWPQGHFHAAAFSYRPLKKGDVDMNATIATLFEAESLQGVLHLLTDKREAAGQLQSEFVRGACWISAVSQIR